jgi:hypothetical protein
MSAVVWTSGPHTDSGGVDAASTAGLETGATRMRNLRISIYLASAIESMCTLFFDASAVAVTVTWLP